MGGNLTTADRERQAQLARQWDEQQRRKATTLAAKLVRHLNRVVIRPGPKPEERECRQVATELEAQIPALTKIILEEGY